MRRQPGRYFISYSFDIETVIDATVTPDEAFHRASKLTKKGSPYSFVVWDLIDGQRNIRAIAVNGWAAWAQPCPKCTGGGSGCYVCNGIGAIARA